MRSVLKKTSLIAAITVLASCSSGPPAPDTSSYPETVAAARAQKDAFFRQDAESPIPPEKRDVLLPLPYFPIDQSYSVPAVLMLSDEQPVFEMPTSTGTLRRYRLVGSIEFTLQGEQLSLGAFVPVGESISTLFVPFADLTTGSETYSAGRYLDIPPTVTGYYDLDFNEAYNPYCAYNESYECPFPPSSNRLAVAIRAGEKSPAG